MSEGKEKCITVRVTLKAEKLKEVREYLNESGANISEFVSMLINKGIRSKENDERLCYECGRVTPAFKNEVRQKIENKFKSLGKFSQVLGINQSYIYTIFNDHRKGSPELWRRILLAIKD